MYTHYYQINCAISQEAFDALTSDAIALAREAKAHLGVDTEFTLNADTFLLNGVPGRNPDESCEDFFLFVGAPPDWTEYGRKPGTFWTKTSRRPYDAVVCGALISLKHHLGDRVELGSDGQIENEEWDAGFRLYHRTFPDRECPDPVLDF